MEVLLCLWEDCVDCCVLCRVVEIILTVDEPYSGGD